MSTWALTIASFSAKVILANDQGTEKGSNWSVGRCSRETSTVAGWLAEAGVAPARKDDAQGLRGSQRLTHVRITADYQHSGIAEDMSLRAENALREGCYIKRRDTMSFNVFWVPRRPVIDEEYPV